jgi:hypothetical protein
MSHKYIYFNEQHIFNDFVFFTLEMIVAYIIYNQTFIKKMPAKGILIIHSVKPITFKIFHHIFHSIYI